MTSSHGEALQQPMRKGTKSCLECRRRKIRCIREDENSICDSCHARDLPCFAQSRSPRTVSLGLPTKDRVSQLERVVHDLMARLSRVEGKIFAPDDTESLTEVDVNSQRDTESDEILDLPPNREPAHLHSLFENAIVGHTGYSANTNYTKHKSTSTTSKRSQLQVELRKLVPSDHDVRLAVELTPDWLSSAGILFYPLAHQSVADILRTFKRVQTEDVEPAEIGEWVLHFAIVLHRLPQHVERYRFTSILDIRDHISRSFETVERLIFNDDEILGTLRGLECGVMIIRL